jgi:hypothetical protein
MMKPYLKKQNSLWAVCLLALLTGCTVEQRNKIGRGVINWTGANGVLDIYAGEKLAMRFIRIEKMTTANATDGRSESRSYRYGYGVLDKNQDYRQQDDEKRLYFEISDYSTNYIFYENPVD